MKISLALVIAALVVITFSALPACAAEAPAATESAAALALNADAVTEASAGIVDVAPTPAPDSLTFPVTPLFDAGPMLRCVRGYQPPQSCVCGGCCDTCRCWNGGHIQKCIE